MESVYLGLPRPQYVSVPEGFIAALAGQVYKVTYDGPPEAIEAAAKLAVAYEFTNADKPSKTLRYHATRPTRNRLGALAQQLREEDLDSEADLARAVGSSILGVRPRKGRGRAAIPMTRALALAQNMQGLVGTANPPDVAKILEKLFELGAPTESDGEQGVAGRWVTAVDRRTKIDPLAKSIDTAMAKTMFTTDPEDGSPSIDIKPDGIKLLRAPSGVLRPEVSGVGTPFSWFYDVWTRLCGDEWVDALPARVWVDWANTVLRLAYGFGYLWEVAWYEAVAGSVAKDDETTARDIVRSVGPLMPWHHRGAAVSVRDVVAVTRWRVFRSNELRDEIQTWVNNNPQCASADEQLLAMRADSEFKQRLTKALSERPGTNPNLWEAINYALVTREASGEDADHYGFLRRHGTRYSVPDPGVEWLAALASLSCGGPSRASNVARLLADLRSLGLRPELSDLISRLEEAGVARGSADADQAVEIQAAF